MKVNDSRIQNNQISASSNWSTGTLPHHGRLDFNIDQGWEPKRGKFCKKLLNFTLKNEKSQQYFSSLIKQFRL